MMATKILYIEDDPLNIRLVRKILEISGFHVLEASDGLSGVAVAAREIPDLILMDINLPGINGLEATARLKASPLLAAIPIIAMTADGADNRTYYIAAGCDGYVPKPFSRNELLTTIQHLLVVEAH